MRTVQLRQYVIVDGLFEEFVEWWRSTMPALRAQAGFTVEFAYGHPETSEFVWAVSVPGDRAEFDRVDAAYQASPERAAAFDGLPQRIASARNTIVEAYA